MKKSLLIIAGFLSFFVPDLAKSQTATFTVPQDTVYAVVNGLGAPTDNITNITYATGMVIQWHVIASNFPADWLTNSAFGICDNKNCYNNGGDTAVWNAATSFGATYKSNTVNMYKIDTPGLFDLNLNLTSVTSSGTYYVTVTLADFSSSYSKNVTFMISRAPTSVNSVNRNTEDVQLYPNPVINDLNVLYDASLDIKTIAVYNIIGKLVAVYKVPSTSANLNLENVPSGIYFVRLANSQGEVVITRKITKN